MLDANAWDAVADIVSAADFYRRDHRLIFEAVAEVIERRSPCDAVTVSEHLERKGLSDETGGLAYLGTLARDTPSAANVRSYAEIVRERATTAREFDPAAQTAGYSFGEKEAEIGRSDRADRAISFRHPRLGRTP